MKYDPSASVSLMGCFNDYLAICQVLWDPHVEIPDRAWEEKNRHITEDSGI